MFNFTPAQAAAVNGITVNQAVMAGAGAGKTRVLVERYLNLLMHSQRPLNSVVAVTFTEKAAAEMRIRVRDRLEAARRDATLTDAYRARAVDLLRQIDSARINTIHSLCAEIIRASAAEAALDPQFAILDEVTGMIVLESAVDDALRAGLASGALGRLVDLGLTLDQIRAVLKHSGRVPPPAPPVVGVVMTSEARMAWQLDRWRAAWRADAEPIIAPILASAEFAACRDYAPLTGFPKQRDPLAEALDTARSLLKHLTDAGDLEAQYAALAACADLPKVGNKGQQGNWGGADAVAAARGVIKQAIAWGETVIAHPGAPPGTIDDHAAAAEADWNSLLVATAAAYQTAKRQRAALDFDDLETVAHDLLTREGSSVRVRFQAEIAALLVDEFQDTSPVQWAILRALAAPDQPGRLFLVGDAKQSIYAFRGADVSVFAQARAEITRAGGEAIAFRDSFRAHLPLVTGFNHLFERILQPQADPPQTFETRFVAATDAMIAHAHTAPDDAPPLEIMLVPNKTSEAARVAERISGLIGTAHIRDGRAIRPATAGDIAILLPAMTASVITSFETALRSAGIPFVTTAGRGYFDRQEVVDVLRLLRALEAPTDDLALAVALRSPLFSLSDEALLALRIPTTPDGQPFPLWDALAAADANPLIPDDERGVIQLAYVALTRLRALAGRVAIADLLTAAFDLTGYLAALEGLPDDGPRRRGNVEKLVEIARSSAQVRLHAFNQYAEALSAAQTREGEALLDAEGAVRIMTIHKSKGLEFPIVFVCAAHHTTRPDKPPALIDPALGFVCRGVDADGALADGYAYRRALRLSGDREAAERRRLLYVAMTRAADRCIVTGKVTGVNEKQSEPQAAGMLGWLVDTALSVTETTMPPVGEAVDLRGVGWTGRLTLEMPRTDEDDQPAGTDVEQAWPDAPPPPAAPPALLAPLGQAPVLSARTLTTLIAADLGAIAHAHTTLREQHRQRARRQLFDDAPQIIRRATPAPIPDVEEAAYTSRVIGDLVRKALRWRDHWAREQTRLRDLLEQFAWESGLTDDGQRGRACSHATALVERELTSDIQTWIDGARRVLRETPFSYRTETGRIIHGQIDVLIERADGTWAVVDFKTARVGLLPTPDQIYTHARRYFLQAGIYAAAAHSLIKRATIIDTDQLDVYLRYILHYRTLAVPAAEWQPELAGLEARIIALMG